jgi:hypothetical protein
MAKRRSRGDVSKAKWLLCMAFPSGTRKAKVNIVSRVRGSVTDNNEFRIGWLDLLPHLQLQSVTTAHNQRLAPFLTGLRVCSLPRWLTWFWYTNWSLQLSAVNTPQLITELSYEWILFYNSGRTEQIPPHRTVRLLLSVFCPLLGNVPRDLLLPSNGVPSTVDCVISGLCLPNRCLAMVLFVTISYTSVCPHC